MRSRHLNLGDFSKGLNQRGQSLLQVIVSIGLMGILTLVFMTMSANQSNQVRNLREKLARADFQQQLTRSFADGSLCTSLLAGVVFAAPGGTLTAASPGGQALAFASTPQSIPASTSALAPALATAGVSVSPISETVVARPTSPFQLSNIVGSSSGAAGFFTANFQVHFDNSLLTQAMAPASTQVALTTTVSGGNQTIVSCMGGAGPSGMSIGGLYVYYPQCGNQNGPCTNATTGWTCGAGGPAYNAACQNACRHANPITGACTCPPGYLQRTYLDFSAPCHVSIHYTDPNVPWPPSTDTTTLCGVHGMICYIP